VNGAGGRLGFCFSASRRTSRLVRSFADDRRIQSAFARLRRDSSVGGAIVVYSASCSFGEGWCLDVRFGHGEKKMPVPNLSGTGICRCAANQTNNNSSNKRKLTNRGKN
jgi:hypothetical protein